MTYEPKDGLSRVEPSLRLDELLDGRYRIERLVARGGMGDVYRAFDVRLHRTVAIKFLARSLCSNESLRERFFREARILARLDHPNLVDVHSLGEQNGRPYMVMRYVEGRTLESMVQARRRLPTGEALGIIVQVCDALSYIHGQGLAHFDVKPANIMIDSAGRCFLLDLGLSGIAGDSASVDGVVYGSLHYMAPELIRNAAMADARADQYALASTLFEALTGDAPFTAETDEALMMRVLEDTPPSLADVGCAATPSLESILARCLRKRPSERFATMGALREALAAELRACVRDESAVEASALRAWLVPEPVAC